MEFGREIPVNGVRPAWLADDTYFRWYGRSMGDNWWDRHSRDGVNGVGFKWGEGVNDIRLPVNHFAYTVLDYNDAHPDEQPMVPWGGGDAAPEDWDQGPPLLRDYKHGTIPPSFITSWKHLQHKNDIIGYRKRTETPADTVTIARMTKAEWQKVCIAAETSELRSSAMDLVHHLGLIRTETTAERFTRETGYRVTPEIWAALAFEREVK